MRPFTLSQADRAAACPGSQALDQTPRSTEAAYRGHVLHAFVRLALDMGPDDALQMIPEDMRLACAQFPLDGIPQDPKAYAGEVAYALDVEQGTARELGRDLAREYDAAGALPHELVGAADFVAWVGDDTVDVADLKTGRGQLVAAADSLQLGGLALAATLAYGRDRARVRLLVRREDGSGFYDEAWLDFFDLEGVRIKLRNAARAVAAARQLVEGGKRPPLVEGPWCTYCPAYSTCPAKFAMVRQLAAAPAEVVADGPIAALTDAECAFAWRRAKEAIKILVGVKAAIANRARQQPIPLGNGWVLRPATKPTEGVNPEVARKTIKAFFAPRGEFIQGAILEKACTYETSKAQIGRAIQPYAGHRGLKRLKDDVLAAIKRDGGIFEKPNHRVSEYHDGLAVDDDAPQLEGDDDQAMELAP